MTDPNTTTETTEEETQIFYINMSDPEKLEIVKVHEMGEELGDIELLTVDNPEAMSVPLSKEQLIQLRTDLRGKEAKGDDKKSMRKLSYEIFAEVFKEKKPAAEKAKKEKKEKKPTKMGMIREILGNGPMDKATLAEMIGSDAPNTNTMISILKNPTRTKDPIFVTYNKATQVYTMYADAEAQEKAEKELAIEMEKLKSEQKKKELDAKDIPTTDDPEE